MSSWFRVSSSKADTPKRSRTICSSRDAVTPKCKLASGLMSLTQSGTLRDRFPKDSEQPKYRRDNRWRYCARQERRKGVEGLLKQGPRQQDQLMCREGVNGQSSGLRGGNVMMLWPTEIQSSEMFDRWWRIVGFAWWSVFRYGERQLSHRKVSSL
ncbi:hypothetical protein LIA77_07879 [Sarocladium implicatum]|jgi:hypothetical protein|nr:hypothetical protein LIA77_07879 [Sarocladium implicatum]